MLDATDTDTASPAFVRRLAAQLLAARHRRHLPVWWLARASEGRFTSSELHQVEAGRMSLRADTVADLAAVYRIDLTELLPDDRRVVDIDPRGVIRGGGSTTTFTPGDDSSLVTAYFRLTRQLRGADDAETVALRHEDVQAVAQFLRDSSAASKYLEAVLAASIAERRVVTGSLVAGAVAIELAGVTDHSSPATATGDGRVSST